MITISNRTADILAEIKAYELEAEQIRERIRALEDQKNEKMPWYEQSKYRLVLSDSAIMQILLQNPDLITAIRLSPNINAIKDGDTTYVYLGFINEPTTEHPEIPNDRELIVNCGGIIEENVI